LTCTIKLIKDGRKALVSANIQVRIRGISLPAARQDNRSTATPSRGRTSPADYPVFFAFGRYHKFLSLDEARAATPEERITSIWPFVVKQATLFIASLHARELANFDADDILLEVWIELRQKDCKWDPAIGSYCSFAGKIIRHLFLRLRERSRTVESPRNTTCRLSEYQQLDEAGAAISPVRRKNWSDISRTISGTARMGEQAPERASRGGPEEECLDAEHAFVFSDAVKQALAQLSPTAARVLGRLHGLWGNPVHTVAEVARELGKSPEQVRKIRDAANQCVRDYLESEFHPTTGEYS